MSTDRRGIAVLGKALEEGRVTVEYATRIAALAKTLEEPRFPYAAVYFVGGKPKSGQPSEAEHGKCQFLGRYRQPGLEIRIEDKSRNSIENVVNLAKLLDDSGFDRVDLLSSDYHLDRIAAVDRFIRNQSLLQKLGTMCGELIRAPYVFSHNPNPTVRFKAEVYMRADSLNVPRVNIEGILQSKERCIFPEVTDHFAGTLIKLHQLWRQSHVLPEGDPLASILPSAVSILDGCLSSMLSLQTRPIETSVDVETLQTLKRLLDYAMGDLREKADQDRPAEDPDWKHIQRTLGLKPESLI